MIQKIRTLLFLGLFSTPFLIAAPVSAQFNPVEKPCEQLTDQQRAESEICNEAGNTDNPVVGEDGILEQVTNILAIVAGVIAVVIIVVAGITMTLSGGDSQKVSNSRNAIIYAAVGIVVVIVARSIVIFVINRIG